MIRNVDLRMCDISDFIFVHWPVNEHLCGSIEEALWANRCKKPVIVWCPQGKEHVPDWLYWSVPHEMFFGTMQDGIKYLQDVDSGEDERHFKRWMFFKLKSPLRVKLENLIGEYSMQIPVWDMSDDQLLTTLQNLSKSG